MYNIKDGYSALKYTRFKLTDYTTWLRPFIYFFDNIWNWIRGQKACKYTHFVIFSEHEGELWVHEAIENGFKRTYTVVDYFKKYDTKDFLLMIPTFEMDLDKGKSAIEEMLKLKYDFIGLLIEIPYLVSDERVWVGPKRKHPAKRVFCTSAGAYYYHKATDGLAFPDPMKIAPIDMYNCEILKKTNIQA